MMTHEQAIGNQEQDNIVGLLKKGIDLGRNFLTLLHEERQALAKMDVTAIAVFSRTKDELITNMQECDGELREAAQAMWEDDHDGHVSLAILEVFFQGEDKKRFQAMRQEFVGVRNKIEDANIVNHGFIQESLSFLGDSIALFTGAKKQGNAYGAVGGSIQTARSPCLISREV